MAHHTPPANESDRSPGGDRRIAPRGQIETDAPIAPGPGFAPALGHGSTPFAWQHGFRLFLLEGGLLGWVLAELRFDPTACHYVEVRRTHYTWIREAAGALLSQTLVAGDESAAKAARDLTSWLAAGDRGQGTGDRRS